MKKLLITATVAVLTLMGCTSDNDDYGSENDMHMISFTKPVIHGGTRAYVGEINGTYPTEENFMVYGVKYPATGEYPGWDGQDAVQVYTANGEEAIYNNTLKGWLTVNQHIFDKTKKYAFGAYSPSSIRTTNVVATSGGSSANTVSYDAEGLHLTGYYCGDAGNQVDLMFAERKRDVSDSYYNGVNLVFRHALASVHFRAFVDPKFLQIEKDVYGYDVKDGDFQIKSITIKGINTHGNFDEAITLQGGGYVETPTWTSQSHMPAEGVCFLNALKKSGGNADADCVTLKIQAGDVDSDEVTLSQDEGRDITHLFTGDDITLKGQSGLMIPQTFTVLNEQLPDAPDARIEILWRHNFISSGVPQTNEMKTVIQLNKFMDQWEMGKRYIFILIFRGNLIYFKPVVTDWVDDETGLSN